MREMTLGQKVKEARIAKQMTQKELAGDFITRNMLSQIENDNAAPSIKTIEHIASVLDKPISYFMDRDQSDQGFIIEELLLVYEDHNYIECINKIEKVLEKESIYHNNDLIKDIYINCCSKAGTAFRDSGDYISAHMVLEKILTFEKDMFFASNIVLYNVYSQLSEINCYLKAIDASKEYDNKATDMIHKMIASRAIQSIYISLAEGNYDDVLQRIGLIEMNELDNHDKGRYYMLIGSAHYYKEEHQVAIPFLEKAIPFFKETFCKSGLVTIYEELSKCYSHLEEYKKAYQYLELTKQIEL
ncbi:MAG: hypothetical protein CVU84_07065 [Firmicutes bacterium HGW-Firmicutes-1]|jgi:transcriptional regulator with XRE-family HTH domain|nr:MAG: hypothetical protein CVU84_07065 [Firmicutes bacterium HGW-Firmicutes-1]